MTMLDRLEKIEQRYQELNRQIAIPEVASNLEQLQRLAQERASFESLVNKYREYKATTKALEEARTMLDGELDEDMAALIKQEIEILEPRQEHLLQEMNMGQRDQNQQP